MIRSLLVLIALASPALAQPSAQDQAKAHFKQGRTLQDAGQFARAADEYKAAYELDHRPEMLFNIAQAFRLGGDKQAAVDYYQRYLQAQPNGAGAVEARAHVTALTAQLAAEQPVTVPDKPIEPVVKPPIVPPVKPPVTPPPKPPAQRSSRPLQIAGLASVGLGVIALGVGVKLGFDAEQAADDISRHTGPWTDTEQARFEEGQRANRNMIIAYVGGGVLVATGTALFVVGRRTHVVPVVGVSSAGAVLWGHF
jgi:tetratricopeptide (TPR) repeat protein